jgi:hypothetical protein
MPSLKFAIFNGFHFHHDMFGYILDYAKSKNITVDIYAHPDPEMGWTAFYGNYFGKLNVFKPEDFDYQHLEKYDLVFLITDDDPHFKANKIVQKNLLKRVVCIDHHASLRNKDLKTHLATRFYISRFWLPWALPSYEYLNLEQKKQFLSKTNQIHVGMVGVTQGAEEEIIKNLIKENPEIVIHYMGRHKPTGEVMNGPNVQHHINAPAKELMDTLSLCHYALVNKSFGSKYTFDALSGTVWLGYTAGCQLIMPIAMKKGYRFQSPIGYFPSQKIKLNQPDLPKVFAEREKLTQRFHRVIDRFLAA